MDLSHMVGLWLAGQGPGVMPGGVGVVYAPAGVGDDESSAGRQGGVGRYPFSNQALSLRDPSGWVSAAGLALIGELEYGPDGLDGFVPRLWSAAGVAMGDGGWGMGDRGTGATIGALLNRGAGSIGLSDRLRFVDRFDREGVLGRACVAGFVEQGDRGRGAGATVVQSCADVAVADFPVMFRTLNDYLRFAVSAQVAGNGYDDVAGVLARSGRPSHAVVVAGVSPEEAGTHGVAPQSRGLGAGAVPGVDPGGDPHLRGAQGRLEVGDVCHSVVYDGAAVALGEIEQAIRAGDAGVLEGEGVSWLRREVV